MIDLLAAKGDLSSLKIPEDRHLRSLAWLQVVWIKSREPREIKGIGLAATRATRV
jgi:hypothetical protein